MASLYEHIGGDKAVNAAVELFYRNVLADGRIARFFDGVDIDKQIAKQKSFLTMAFGGPNNYTGLDMCNAHKTLVAKALTDSHVDAVIDNLNRALRQLGVGEKEVKEVAALALEEEAPQVNQTAYFHCGGGNLVKRIKRDLFMAGASLKTIRSDVFTPAA